MGYERKKGLGRIIMIGLLLIVLFGSILFVWKVAAQESWEKTTGKISKAFGDDEPTKSKINTTQNTTKPATNETKKNETKKNETTADGTVPGSSGGSWFIYILLFMIIVGLMIYIFMTRAYKGKELLNVDECRKIAYKVADEHNYTIKGNGITHSYKNFGEHPRYAFFFHLNGFGRNHDHRLLNSEESCMIDVCRREGRDGTTGPLTMTWDDWKEWINLTSKGKTGEVISLTRPYQDFDFFSDSEVIQEEKERAIGQAVGEHMTSRKTGG